MARRLRPAMVLIAAIVCAMPLHANNQSPVQVREERGMYHVAASFRVPQPVAIVTQVLTDYEQVPKFMPDVERSVVKSRDGAWVLVEQEIVAKFMMFNRRLRLTLDIEETPDIIRFRDVAGESFSCYEGRWVVATDDGTTIVRYELAAKPTFSVPGFVLSRLLRRDATRMIDGLRTEMAARGK